MRPALYATGLTVSIGGVRIVEDVDLAVAHGDWTTIIGPNGAGKSTILRAVAGLVRSTGRVELGGVDRAGLSGRAVARQVAYVAQRAALPDSMTVDHYVLLGRTPHLARLAKESAHDHRVAREAMDALDLGPFATRRLGSLSGGERQRVVLARALAQEPALLLLDEPTTALDVGHQQDVLELVDRLRRERSLAVLSTMHDLTLAAQYGEHLVLVADGRIVASGPPVQVLTGTEVARHYRAHVDVIRHRGGLVVVPVRSHHDQEDPHARA